MPNASGTASHFRVIDPLHMALVDSIASLSASHSPSHFTAPLAVESSRANPLRHRRAANDGTQPWLSSMLCRPPVEPSRSGVHLLSFTIHRGQRHRRPRKANRHRRCRLHRLRRQLLAPSHPARPSNDATQSQPLQYRARRRIRARVLLDTLPRSATRP